MMRFTRVKSRSEAHTSLPELFYYSHIILVYISKATEGMCVYQSPIMGGWDASSCLSGVSRYVNYIYVAYSCIRLYAETRFILPDIPKLKKNISADTTTSDSIMSTGFMIRSDSIIPKLLNTSANSGLISTWPITAPVSAAIRLVGISDSASCSLS